MHHLYNEDKFKAQKYTKICTKNILLFIEKKTKIQKKFGKFGKIFRFFNNYLILFIMRSSINLMKIKNTRY